VRVPLIILTLLACPAFACGKIQAPADRDARGPDELTAVEAPAREVAAAPSVIVGETSADPAAESQATGTCVASPPPLVLQSAGGEQAGAISSYCIDNAQLGCGLCADRLLRRSETFTVTHPGDELTVAMPGARFTTSPRCVPACSLEALIAPAICFRGQLAPPGARFGGSELVSQRTLISQDTPWTLAVPPGLYFITIVGGDFATTDGWTGGASGMFGLLVDPERDRGSVNADTLDAECPKSSSADAGIDAGGVDSGGVDADGGVTSTR
jgi:hypothetical protein